MHYRATPRELLARFSFPELCLMFGFEKLEPFGFPEQDYHAALQAQTTANFAGKVLGDPLSLDDFMMAIPEPESEADSLARTETEMALMKLMLL